MQIRLVVFHQVYQVRQLVNEEHQVLQAHPALGDV